MAREINITEHTNGVIVKSDNKRISVVKAKEGVHIIEFKSLTIDTGEALGSISKLSKNKKLKFTALGLTDEGLLDLYVALREYVKIIPDED